MGAPALEALDRYVFRHEALPYDGIEDFVARTGSLVREAVDRDEEVLVVVDRPKIEALRRALGDTDGRVRFADMADVGRNPARIIPVWRGFVAERRDGGRPFGGVGEAIWAGRSADEVAECLRHEALVNLAFDGGPAWWLACPYDLGSLEPSVVEEAMRNHPAVLDRGFLRPSGSFRGLAEISEPFDEPLPEPAGPVERMAFGPRDMDRVRRLVGREAAASGAAEARIDDLVLAVSEVATNTILHGGGRGSLRLWRTSSSVVCEVSDAGRIRDPLVGRGRPDGTGLSGFGLWIANQVCDLVQVRSSPAGSVVRLHVSHRRPSVPTARSRR